MFNPCNHIVVPKVTIRSVFCCVDNARIMERHINITVILIINVSLKIVFGLTFVAYYSAICFLFVKVLKLSAVQPQCYSIFGSGYM